MRASIVAYRELFTSPLGPERWARAARRICWPLLRAAAWTYRRTLLRNMRVIAGTGSFGKTTAPRAIAAALNLPPHDGAKHSAQLALKLLATDRRTQRRALEVAIDGPGQMQGMARMVRPDVAALVGIGSEHNRSLPTLRHTL